MSRTMTSNDYFDVERCRTCAYTITTIVIRFNQEAEFETKYILSFIPFWVIMML